MHDDRHCGALVELGPTSHENLTGAESEARLSRGAFRHIAVAGRLALHHGGSLDQPSLAWRLAGKAGAAPVVLALGGISAHRRVFDTEQPRAGLVVRDRRTWRARSTARACACSASIIWAAAGSPPRRRRAACFPACRATIRPRRYLRRSARSSAGGAAARHRRGVLWRHGGAGIRRAFRRQGRAVAGDQRRGSYPSDVHGVAQRAAAAHCASRSPPGIPPTAWNWRVRWPWRPIAARRSLPRASPSAAAGRRAIRLSGRGIPVRARARLRRALSGRIISMPVGVDRSACSSMPAASRRRPRWWRCGKTSWCRSATCVRWPRGCPMRRLHELSSPYGHDTFLKEAAALQPVFATLYGDVT
jgi:hypothetical protein